MKRIFNVAAILLLFVAGLAGAQAQTPKKDGVKFTSVYTDLKTQCGSGLTRKEEKQAEESGQDIPSLCKGYGGYEIFLASDGATTQFQVRVKSLKREKDVVVMETLSIADPIYLRKVEWRLADGVPFAVIFRRDINDETKEDPIFLKKVGEGLRVLGLKDESIDFWVDVKKSQNPNAEARRLADQAYFK